MAEPLPRWIMKRYSILWNKFKDKEFTHKQATEALKEKENIGDRAETRTETKDPKLSPR